MEEVPHEDHHARNAAKAVQSRYMLLHKLYRTLFWSFMPHRSAIDDHAARVLTVARYRQEIPDRALSHLGSNHYRHRGIRLHGQRHVQLDCDFGVGIITVQLLPDYRLAAPGQFPSLPTAHMEARGDTIRAVLKASQAFGAAERPPPSAPADICGLRDIRLSARSV